MSATSEFKKAQEALRSNLESKRDELVSRYNEVNSLKVEMDEAYRGKEAHEKELKYLKGFASELEGTAEFFGAVAETCDSDDVQHSFEDYALKLHEAIRVEEGHVARLTKKLASLKEKRDSLKLHPAVYYHVKNEWVKDKHKPAGYAAEPIKRTRKPKRDSTAPSTMSIKDMAVKGGDLRGFSVGKTG